jgi:hypothetical protein
VVWRVSGWYFACGNQTPYHDEVDSAAGLSEQFQRIFYHLTKIGRKYPQLFEKMLEQILE